MIVFFLFMSILMIFFGAYWYSKFSNPLSVFGVAWSIVFIVYTFELFPSFQWSETTYLSVFSVLFGYFVGSFIALPKFIKMPVHVDLDIVDQYVAVVDIITILMWIGLFSVLYYILTNPVELIAYDEFQRLDSTLETASAVEREFFYKIGLPFLNSSFLFSLVLMFRLEKCAKLIDSRDYKKIKKKLITIMILTFIALVSYDVFSLKRMQTINMAICILAAISVSNLPTARYFSILYKSSPIIVVFFMLMYYVSIERDVGVNDSIFQSWLLYYAGPISYFNSITSSGMIDQNYYGLSSIMGFLSYNFSFIAAALGLPYGVPFYYDRQTPLQIGDHLYFNAFGSFMLDGYYDYGVIGVFFLALLSGFVFTKMHARVYFSNSFFNISISAISIAWIIFLPIAWTPGLQSSLGQAPYFLIIIYVAMKLKKVKKLSGYIK